MSALDSQYLACFGFYEEYIQKYLNKDIKEWEAKNKYTFNLTADDIEDIRSELKCLLLIDINKKYENRIPIRHPRNYVLTVCKNDLKNTLIKMVRLRKNESRYEHEWKLKMIDAKNRKDEHILTILDKYPYVEVRELFKSALDIREMAIVYLFHSDFDYIQIAKTLKISEDYCRKIYNQAEGKLKNALGFG
jgi:DNA-directed RNA polymerase specialized sigma24 family protein